jgi:hypothetical protein
MDIQNQRYIPSSVEMVCNCSLTFESDSKLTRIEYGAFLQCGLLDCNGIPSSVALPCIGYFGKCSSLYRSNSNRELDSRLSALCQQNHHIPLHRVSNSIISHLTDFTGGHTMQILHSKGFTTAHKDQVLRFCRNGEIDILARGEIIKFSPSFVL